jgi:nucleotide-binding universal stress UspA family protein
MKNILVPIDFSNNSLNAIILAKQLARKTEGSVTILHVVEIPSRSYSSMGEILEDDMENIYTMHFIDVIRKRLNDLKDDHESPAFKLKVILKIGDPYDEIMKLYEAENIEMIFMGAKGVSEREGLYLGSLCEKILRTISCPVISVKDVNVANRFKKIVYATDLKSDNINILGVIKSLQSLFDSTIHVVKINTRDNFKSDIDNMNELEKLAQKYELKNYSLDVFNHTNEEDGIVHFAELKNADLIALGIHERTGIRRLISGGLLTEDIAEHTNRPVLTYHIELNRD